MNLIFTIFIIINAIFVARASAEEGKALIYGVSEPLLSLNPFSGTGFTMWQAHQLIFEFLLYEIPGKRDVFRPGLAKKWTISKDKKVFEFELRDSKWTDGKPVTAEDVKFSVEHIFDKRYKSIWVGSFEGIEKVEVLGPLKIRITAKSAAFDLWKSLVVSLKIVPKHFYVEPDLQLYHKQALGSGPYKLDSFDSGNKFSLVKNTAWWGWQDSELKTWYSPEKIKFIKLSSASIPAHFQKNEIDYLRVTEIQLVQTLKKNSELNLDFVVNPNRNQKIVEQILFNFDDPLFSKLQVREALNLVVDRKNLCEKTYEGSRPAGLFDFKKGLAKFKDLGWADHNKDGVLDKNGKPFEFTVIYSSQDYEIVLTRLKEILKAAGITLNLQVVDYSLMQKIKDDKKFNSYIDRFDDNQTFLSSVWHSGGSYNWTSFSDKFVDSSLTDLEKTFDSVQRARKVKSLREKISKLKPSLTLCEIQIPDFVINKKSTSANVRKGVLQWGWF